MGQTKSARDQSSFSLYRDFEQVCTSSIDFDTKLEEFVAENIESLYWFEHQLFKVCKAGLPIRLDKRYWAPCLKIDGFP
jgi:hypothetical protein